MNGSRGAARTHPHPGWGAFPPHSAIDDTEEIRTGLCRVRANFDRVAASHPLAAHRCVAGMSWPRDDAKLDRVRALMAERGLDALVVRAPDNVLYLTNFWGMKGYDAVVFPREGEPVADLPRGVGRPTRTAWPGRPTSASSPGMTRDDPRPPGAACARPRQAAAPTLDGRPRALARHAGIRPHGRRADDLPEGLVRRVSRTPSTRRRSSPRRAR